jgi:hypothetical protein
MWEKLGREVGAEGWGGKEKKKKQKKHTKKTKHDEEVGPDSIQELTHCTAGQHNWQR